LNYFIKVYCHSYFILVVKFKENISRFVGNLLTGLPFFSLAGNVWRLGEGGDFKHKTSHKEPHFNYTKNRHTKHCSATFAKPLL